MKTDRKSTVEEIRERFDHDVERFSNLDTGQSAAMDAPLALELISEAAAEVTPHAQELIDIGCGAGNFTLKLLQRLPDLNVRLIDLSRPMLDRAVERVSAETGGTVTPIRGDIRQIDLACESSDLIVAAAVLHHLRTEDEWRQVFRNCYQSLRPGGSFWIFDMIEPSIGTLKPMMQKRYGDYLASLEDEAYRDHVFAYIEKEDTPRSLIFQLDELRAAGFSQVEVLHKNVAFAAFGGIKL
jgi:tRNA (cmo5U34)-methyltransferase